LTREPSGRRASTIGDDSSMRRPTAEDDAVDDLEEVAVVLSARRWVPGVPPFHEHLLVGVHQV
jgi:hypothetical protein